MRVIMVMLMRRVGGMIVSMAVIMTAAGLFLVLMMVVVITAGVGTFFLAAFSDRCGMVMSMIVIMVVAAVAMHVRMRMTVIMVVMMIVVMAFTAVSALVADGEKIEQSQNHETDPCDQHHGLEDAIGWQVVGNAIAGVEVKQNCSPEQKQGHTHQMG